MHFGRDSVIFFCVMVLAMQCMVIHTALSLSRNTDELSGGTEPSLMTQTLAVAARGLVYPPMMCMLFVSCRMFVLSATGGSGEPQLWVKICMVAATFGKTLHFLIILLYPMYTDHWHAEEGKADVRLEELAGEPTDVYVQMELQSFINTDDCASFEALQALSIAFIYCGMIGVVVGILTFPEGTTEISTAVLCTIYLAVLYFGIYFLLLLGHSSGVGEDGLLGHSSGVGGFPSVRLHAAARQALLPIRKVPMLAVIFLASRMRALQLNPPSGMPTPVEHWSFIAICFAVSVETMVALIIGATGEEQSSHYGLPLYKSSHSLHLCMCMAGLLVYLSLIPIVHGIFVVGGVDGPPLSTTTTAVLQLGTLYFLANILQWLIFTLEDLGATDLEDAKAVVLAADVSVRLCPLVSILFVACRLRALQLTQQQGAPQMWAQQAMFLATFAMMVQMLSCIALPLAMGRSAPVDGDGYAEWNAKPVMVAYVVAVMKYVALFSLHWGMLMVSMAIFVMTPESAYQSGESDNGLLEDEIMEYCVLVSLASLCLALFFSFARALGILLKITVEAVDRHVFGCDIWVHMAAISLLSGWVNIADVTVENPKFPIEGSTTTWSTPHLMKVKRVRADLDMVQLAMSGGTVFEFEEILLQDVEVNYDKPWMLKDNVSTVSENIARATASASEKFGASSSDSSDQDVKVIFHRITIQGISAQVFVSGPSGLGGQMNVALADIHFDDFASQVCDYEAVEHVERELILFVVRSIMETVTANVGPGKQVQQGMKGCTDFASKHVTSCLQGVNPCKESFGKELAAAGGGQTMPLPAK